MPWVQIAHCKWDSNSANIFQLCGFLQTENIGLSTYPLVIKHDWKIFHDWFGDFHSYKPNQLEKGMSQLTHRLLRLFPGPNASVAARHLDAWRQLAGGKILQSISKIWWKIQGFPWYIPSQFPTWHHLDNLVGWFPWTFRSPPLVKLELQAERRMRTMRTAEGAQEMAPETAPWSVPGSPVMIGSYFHGLTQGPRDSFAIIDMQGYYMLLLLS